MRIHHRGIYQDRFDTPYGIGTLIWARDCHYNCKGCIHSDRYDLPIYVEDSKDIITKVKSNPFTQGIVLGGFEWTEQEEEMYDIIEAALSEGLQVILYTHHTLTNITLRFPKLLKYFDIYIKVGAYEEDKRVYDYTSYGVPLATYNQVIYKVGVDI